MTSQVVNLSHLDATQVKLLEEECILIDKDDHKVGSATKKVCHLLKNIEKGCISDSLIQLMTGELVTHWRSIAKRGGCFQWHMIVSGCVCLST